MKSHLQGAVSLGVLCPSIQCSQVQLCSAFAGDGDGQNEMNWSMNYLKKFLNTFQDDAAAIRVFFPDNMVRPLQLLLLVNLMGSIHRCQSCTAHDLAPELL